MVVIDDDEQVVADGLKRVKQDLNEPQPVLRWVRSSAYVRVHRRCDTRAGGLEHLS